jgi:hypothetical protein
MTFRLILGSVALAVALSGSALAATTSKPAPKMTGAEICTTLEKQYDAALPTHQTAKYLKAAKSREAKGIAACTAKKYVTGRLQLRRALIDLGVKPTA